MYLLSALLFALSANIDSFIIGISCGIRKSKISIPQILLISLITLCGTVAALAAGGELLCLFPLPYAEYTGKFILIIFGLYYAAKFTFMNIFHPIPQYDEAAVSCCLSSETDPPFSCRTLSWKSACIFGFSLSVNNLGIGLGASISGLHLIPSALISFTACIFFLLIGNHAGRCISFQKSERYADLCCGMFLILLGFFC
ncbi:manganese efflux pump [Mediterraneibacter agrestimuris]|uniref:manganese efflux pump n=1 Tax=Mediterraneibacter agrestimuris TaxID=2941333 RepID=UPI00203E2125|nr:manganese efflux pump [Mediterraneibacter agrestimuris]